MNVYTILIGAVLGFLALALPALAHSQHWTVIRESWKRPRSVLWGLVAAEGGFTVTYLSDFTNVNTSTPPTAAQAASLPCQVAQVFFADTDTSGVVVHNWGVLLGPSFATFGWPVCVLDAILLGTTDSFLTNFTYGLTNSNQVTLTKPVGTGTGGTYLLYMFLPSSFMARAR